MAKQIQKYIDDLGNEFDTEAEADSSNQSIQNEGSIEAFIFEVKPAKAQAGLYRRILPQYLAFRASDEHHDKVMDANERIAAAKAAARASTETPVV